MKKLVIIVIVLAMAGFGGFWMFFRTPVVDPNLIQVSGNIKIIDAEVSLKMAGRVNSRPVEEGLLVQKDDLDDAELKSELNWHYAKRSCGVDGFESFLKNIGVTFQLLLFKGNSDEILFEATPIAGWIPDNQ